MEYVHIALLGIQLIQIKKVKHTALVFLAKCLIATHVQQIRKYAKNAKKERILLQIKKINFMENALPANQDANIVIMQIVVHVVSMAMA